MFFLYCSSFVGEQRPKAPMCICSYGGTVERWRHLTSQWDQCRDWALILTWDISNTTPAIFFFYTTWHYHKYNIYKYICSKCNGRTKFCHFHHFEVLKRLDLLERDNTVQGNKKMLSSKPFFRRKHIFRYSFTHLLHWLGT